MIKPRNTLSSRGTKASMSQSPGSHLRSVPRFPLALLSGVPAAPSFGLCGFAFPRSRPRDRFTLSLRSQLNRALVKHDYNSSGLSYPRIGLKLLWALCVLAAALPEASAATITPQTDKVVPAIPDRQDFQTPDRVRLTGWVGMRIDANEANRLVKLDPARLLEGYRKRPGRQSWDGEHVGKWLHAATLAWVNTGDPALRAEARLRGRRIGQVPARQTATWALTSKRIAGPNGTCGRTNTT